MAKPAAVLVMGLFLLPWLQGDAVPTAEAAVDRALRALESARDTQFVSHLYLGDAPERPGRVPEEWSVRGDRWVIRAVRPRGVHWVGGDGARLWWVAPEGRLVEWPVDGPNPLPRDFDVSLLLANPVAVLRLMRAGYAMTAPQREQRDGIASLHLKATRPRPASRGGFVEIDCWTEEATGRLLRGEYQIETAKGTQRKLVLVRSGSEPKADDYYLPSGHAK